MNTLVETYFALAHHRTRETTDESLKELAVKIIKEIILLDINKE